MGNVNIKYTIQFHTYWHCGSGLAAGADVDALVIKHNGLPYMPGKTAKGLLKEAVVSLYSFRGETLPREYFQVFGCSPDDLKEWQGKADGTDIRKAESFFTNAELPSNDKKYITQKGLQSYLYESVSRTAIDENGIAKEHSLRKVEVALPCVLEGEILNVPECMVNVFRQAMGLIRQVGVNRNRGLGRCSWTVEETIAATQAEVKSAGEQTRLAFRMKLDTDIILNQKAATKGPNETLDYIPGSSILGIVASQLYKDGIATQDALDLFHNGTVRYGDAHPANGMSRSNKVPAAMFYPKGQKPSDIVYISYLHPEQEDEQLKQCRSGFYDFTDDKTKVAVPLKRTIQFAIKSAHDRQTRTSKEKQMYGYESLAAGAEFLFEVEVDRPQLAPSIIEALQGQKRVGRSRSAQYGLVTIEYLPQGYAQIATKPDKDVTIVYADSRLVFIDPNTGMPTYQPTVQQLGFSKGEIVWEKSQLRTFQYAPWNFKRQCFDTDRCGVEKGSVFYVKGAEFEDGKTKESLYVGNYRNEGFGRVIYNPNFLQADANGISDWKLLETRKPTDNEKHPEIAEPSGASGLLQHVIARYQEDFKQQKLLEEVNCWVSENKRLFGDSFNSQWGTIRSIATRRLTKSGEEGYTLFTTLADELFTEVKDKPLQCGYLMHGTAKDKWNKSNRAYRLKFFLTEVLKTYSEQEKCLAIINLAAEMAKQSN